MRFTDNFFKSHFLFKSSNDVATLCQNLFATSGLNYFDYVRLYDDGSSLLLSSDAGWAEHYLKREYPLGATLKSSSGAFLWNTYCSEILINEAKIYGKHDFGISFYFKHKNYIEAFDFAAPPGNHQILNFYINHRDIIEKFCLEFRDFGAPIIYQADRNLIKVPKPVDENLQQETYSKKINAISYRRTTTISPADPKLSLRELDCLLLILQGKTMRQIASHLGLSPRTVESYSVNLKNKFGCHTKSELIAIAIEKGFVPLHFYK